MIERLRASKKALERLLHARKKKQARHLKQQVKNAAYAFGKNDASRPKPPKLDCLTRARGKAKG